MYLPAGRVKGLVCLETGGTMVDGHHVERHMQWFAWCIHDRVSAINTFAIEFLGKAISRAKSGCVDGIESGHYSDGV